MRCHWEDPAMSRSTILLSREEALAMLALEPVRHFTMATLLRDAVAPRCHRVGDSLLVRAETADGPFVWMAVAHTADVEPLVAELDGRESLYYVQGDEAAASIRRRFPIGIASDCMQFALPPDVPVEADEEGIVDLHPEQAEYIHAHYSYRDVVTVAYLRERIGRAPAVGVMVDGQLAGFVMTHEELTMGVMHVLPEYRRLGLATRLNAALVRRMRALGLPCLVEIVHDNTASLGLAASAGFVPVQKVHWMHPRTAAERQS